jgi:sigma-E factor negative regulatory protein RseC
VIEEQGIVIARTGDIAEVEVRRRSGCHGCSVQGACGTSLIDRYLGRRKSLLQVDNALDVVPGDEVVVGVSDAVLLRAAVAAYLVPLIGLIGGAVVAIEVAARLPALQEQTAALVGALLGFVLALRWVRHYGRRLQADPRFRAVLLRRAGASGVAVRLD